MERSGTKAPGTRNETFRSVAEKRLLEQRSETPQPRRGEEACGAGAFPKKVGTTFLVRKCDPPKSPRETAERSEAGSRPPSSLLFCLEMKSLLAISFVALYGMGEEFEAWICLFW